MYNFEGKVVFATGAASGMALLLCREFVKHGGAAVLADCGRNVMFDKIHGDYGKYD